MAGLTKKQLDQLKGLDGIDKGLLSNYKPNMQSAPQGQVLGANSTLPAGLNPAQLGGASGMGFETPENQAVISEQTQNTIEAGGSRSQVGNTISSSQAKGLAKSFGLEGIVDTSKYAGLSYGEAAAKVQAERQKRTGQVTSNVSFAFNPETLAGTKKIVDRVGIGLNDITKQSWDSKGTQQDKIQATLAASAKQIASLFQSQEEYNNAVASSPQLQQTLATFEKLGGSAQDISSKIATPVTDKPEQTTGDYLSNLTNPEANQEAQQQAINELIPEKDIIQAEIARQQSIPEEAMSLYFGTEEQLGILDMKKTQAIEEKRIIEQQELDAETNLKAKAKLAISKNNAEMRIQTTTIEENRLAAKNYMTGMLAKLGALKTTGAAPLAIQTLDTKYEISKQTLESKYKFAEQEINLQLDDALNTLETNTDQSILELEQDLTKDYEDITKEVMKLQQAADKQTYTLSIKYASKLRERTTSYTKALKAEAEKYAKEYAKTAGGGLNLNSLSNAVEGQYVAGKGVLNPMGGYNKLSLTKSQEAEVSRSNLQGTDAVKYFVSLSPADRRVVMQDAQTNGTNMTANKIRAVIAESKKKPEKKETSNTTATEDEEDFNIV